MAQKRMFSLSVIDTDEFIEMPISARLLYYELGMRADDDGFVPNWKKILLFTGTKEDDMKILISKSFIIPFESGVIVIRHWRLNNYLQKDRYKETIYKQEMALLSQDENGVYSLDTDCIHDVYKLDTQNSIDKNSIDKNSITCQKHFDDELSSSFEEVWKIYPRKQNKANAYKFYKILIKGKDVLGIKKSFTHEQIFNAVKRYADEKKNDDIKFIKMGDTFFNNGILDYIEDAKEEKEEITAPTNWNDYPYDTRVRVLDLEDTTYWADLPVIMPIGEVRNKPRYKIIELE